MRAVAETTAAPVAPIATQFMTKCFQDEGVAEVATLGSFCKAAQASLVTF